MKILFTSHFYAFQNPGGGEMVLLKTREALQKKGIQVDLFDQWTTKFKDYDIIHDFTSLSWRNWHTYKSYGPKLVVTPVMWPNVEFPAPQVEKAKHSIRKMIGANHPEVSFLRALELPDLFLPTTRLEQQRIQTRYGMDGSRFQVIPNGINIPIPMAGDNVFKRSHGDEDYLLYVGRISPLKNVRMIVEAAKRSQKKLFVIGSADEQDRDYAEELKKRSPSQVTFLSPLPNDSQMLADAYRGAKAVVVASQFETCSLVGMEAGSYGTPVIMTERGGTKEVYRDLVHYVDPGQIDTLINAINKIWIEPRNEKLQKHIIENYTWDKVTDLLLKSYQKVITNAS